MPGKKINYDIEPKSFKIIKIAAPFVVLGVLAWLLIPRIYHDAKTSEMAGTWLLYSGGYDATGVLELHADGTYATRVEGGSGRHLEIFGLAPKGRWLQQGNDFVFTDQAGISLNTFHAEVSLNHKKLKLTETVKNFFQEFDRRD